jgi:hypothetical protein
MLRVLPLDDPLSLTTAMLLAAVLTHLERPDEAVNMFEDVVPKLIRVLGECHKDTLMAMFDMAFAQFILNRFDDSKQTASRGLLLARRVGNDYQAAQFVDTLSKLGEIEEHKIFAATAADEQMELRNKINRRKWAKEKAADEAACLAIRVEATTEEDLDALMAQFGFEEGDDCRGEKGEEKKKSGGGSKKKKKKKKGK